MSLTYYTYPNPNPNKSKKTVYLLPIFKDNYVFIIVNDKNQGLIVDPGESVTVKEFLKIKKIEPVSILITHSHLDHIGGVEDLVNTFPEIKVARHLNLTAINELELYDFYFDVLPAPGHIQDHVMFFERNERWLFCGDVLFRFGCGRIFDGSYEELYNSLGKIKKLSRDTMIFCTHEYTANNLDFCIKNNFIPAEKIKNLVTMSKAIPTIPFRLEEELILNPFLGMTNLKDFEKIRKLRNQF